MKKNYMSPRLACVCPLADLMALPVFSRQGDQRQLVRSMDEEDDDEDEADTVWPPSPSPWDN